MAQNLRERIAHNIETVLKDMIDPKCVLVTREPFDIEKLAVTQFPAIMITAAVEERETVTMGMGGVGRRRGQLDFEIRGFVRGVELDRKRNDLIERIEETLEGDRYRELLNEGVLDSQVVSIEVPNRMPPLAEIIITYRVKYNYVRTET